MKGRILTENQIAAFSVYLKSEEKSENTVGKYIRDVRAFATYVGVAELTKETVIAYKNKLLTDNYAARMLIQCSLLSMDCSHFLDGQT